MRKEVAEKIKELEELEIDRWERDIASVDELRQIYSDNEYKKIVDEIYEELKSQYKDYLVILRDSYNAAHTFAEKSKIYEKILAGERVVNKPRKPLPPYEQWVDDKVLAHMKAHGYRQTIRFYIRLEIL